MFIKKKSIDDNIIFSFIKRTEEKCSVKLYTTLHTWETKQTLKTFIKLDHTTDKKVIIYVILYCKLKCCA